MKFDPRWLICAAFFPIRCAVLATEAVLLLTFTIFAAPFVAMTAERGHRLEVAWTGIKLALLAPGEVPWWPSCDRRN